MVGRDGAEGIGCCCIGGGGNSGLLAVVVAISLVLCMGGGVCGGVGDVAASAVVAVVDAEPLEGCC